MGQSRAIQDVARRLTDKELLARDADTLTAMAGINLGGVGLKPDKVTPKALVLIACRQRASATTTVAVAP